MPCIYLCCHQWEKIILLLTQCILRVTSIICWAFLSGNLKILVKIPPRLSQRGVTILPLGSCRARNDIFLMLSNIGEGMNQNNLTFCQRLYVCAKHVIYEIHGLSAQSKQQSKCTGQWSKYNSSIQMPSGKKLLLFKTIWGFTNAQTRTEQGRSYEYNILTLSSIIPAQWIEKRNVFPCFLFMIWVSVTPQL